MENRKRDPYGFDVDFQGVLTEDPKVRVGGSSGEPWATMNIRQGEGDDAQYVDVKCFKDVAREVRNMTKGDKVRIVGNMWMGKWQGNDGLDKYKLKVRASEVHPLKLGAYSPRAHHKGNAALLLQADTGNQEDPEQWRNGLPS